VNPIRLSFVACVLGWVVTGLASAAQSADPFAALSPQLTERIRKNRTFYRDPAQLEAWIPRLPEEIVAKINVRYATPPGSDPRLTSLDVFHARHATARQPVVIFVHGGGFSAGDKSHSGLIGNKARFFPAHGIVFVSVNYRLAPEVVHPAQTHDVADAVAFVRAHAAEWGGDPDALFLIGHSAGAQLVAQIVTDPAFLDAREVPRAAIRGVISVDTQLFDIPAALAHSKVEAPLREIVAMMYGKSPAEWRAASPITHLTAARHWPPLLLFHSTEPASPSAVAANHFAAAWRAAGGKAELQPAREKDHPSLGRDIGNADDWITDIVMRFLSENSGRGAARDPK
jgi:acetyl esterase/lipase